MIKKIEIEDVFLKDHIEIITSKINQIIDYLNREEKNRKDATEWLKTPPKNIFPIFAKDKWISVDTAMPPNEEQVLVFGKVKDGECPLAIDEIYNGRWVQWGVQHSADRGHVITHWMPLPEPPD